MNLYVMVINVRLKKIHFSNPVILLTRLDARSCWYFVVT